MMYDLPESVTFGGREWAIDTDFRAILDILTAFEDKNLTNVEKVYICLLNFYPEFEDIPGDMIEEAYKKAVSFIDRGGSSKGNTARTMDWEQDAGIIFPALNHVAGFEVRSAEHLHWWTFLGYFMEIKDSVCATVFSLRHKRAKGKKLEKWELEFWRNNRDICELGRKLTDEQRAAKEAERERIRKIIMGK